RTPSDAAEQVEYFNGGSDTKMGALRARNGHKEPYAIRYWQVGNEVASPEYEAKLPDFCRAMKAVDPSMKLFSSFPTAGVVHGAGELLDFVSPHQYTRDLPAMERDLSSISKMLQEN